jgi:hypothetical protein
MSVELSVNLRRISSGAMCVAAKAKAQDPTIDPTTATALNTVKPFPPGVTPGVSFTYPENEEAALGESLTAICALTDGACTYVPQYCGSDQLYTVAINTAKTYPSADPYGQALNSAQLGSAGGGLDCIWFQFTSQDQETYQKLVTFCEQNDKPQTAAA